eukprot:403336012
MADYGKIGGQVQNQNSYINNGNDYLQQQPQSSSYQPAIGQNLRNRSTNNYHFSQHTNQPSLLSQQPAYNNLGSIGMGAIGNPLQGNSKQSIASIGVNDLSKNPITGAGFDQQSNLRRREGANLVGQEISSMKAYTAIPDARSYNPFGKGGSGAPFKDRDGNVIPNRRPYSQVRDTTPTLHSSNSNKNIYQNQPQNGYGMQNNLNANQYQSLIPERNQFANLNQSIDVGQLHMNYYNNAQQNISNTPQIGNQSGLPQGGPVVSNKITSFESEDQKEQRMKKQFQYQEVLKLQMEEKKAKEDAIKRKRMEDDLKQEMRIKEDIEKEKQIQIQEKLKLEQKQNQYKQENHDNIFQAKGKKQAIGKMNHSPISQSSKFQNQPVIQQQENGYKRELDLNSIFNQNSSQNPHPQGQIAQSPISLNMGLQQNQQNLFGVQNFNQPSITNLSSYGLINAGNQPQFQHIESQFQSEIYRLKSDMLQQQQNFDSKLQELRSEAQRNIDYRLKAEQELQRVKLNSQRDSQRPTALNNMIGSSSQSSRDQANSNNGMIRRSMAGMNNYERMFFGGQNQQAQPHVQSTYVNIDGSGVQSLQSQNDMNQFIRNLPDLGAQGQSRGLGGKFEGSISLKADSAFIPVLQGLDLSQKPYFEQSNNLAIHNPQYQNSNQFSKNSLVNDADKYDGDVSLNYLENAIEEISELNMGENYKQTQQALREAREQQKMEGLQNKLEQYDQMQNLIQQQESQYLPHHEQKPLLQFNNQYSLHQYQDQLHQEQKELIQQHAIQPQVQNRPKSREIKGLASIDQQAYYDTQEERPIHGLPQDDQTLATNPFEKPIPTLQIIPEYKGLQQNDIDEDINHLAYQLNQVNQAQSLNYEKQLEKDEIKKEYLMRNITLQPIMESSNEHTLGGSQMQNNNNNQGVQMQQQLQQNQKVLKSIDEQRNSTNKSQNDPIPVVRKSTKIENNNSGNAAGFGYNLPLDEDDQ